MHTNNYYDDDDEIRVIFFLSMVEKATAPLSSLKNKDIAKIENGKNKHEDSPQLG